MANKSLYDKYASEGSGLLDGKGPFVNSSPDQHPSSNQNSDLHVQGSVGTREQKANHSLLDLDGKEPDKYENREDLR